MHDPLYETADPNGSVQAHRGKIAIYFDGTVYHKKINIDGDTAWADYSDFITGDWIVSSVDTARTGWTDVSATYADKFIRINAVPLSTSGADAHTHSVPAHSHGAVTGSHTLIETEMPAHTHTLPLYVGTGSTGYYIINQTQGAALGNASGSTGGGGGHTHTVTEQAEATSGSGANVPVYMTACLFQKD